MEGFVDKDRIDELVELFKAKFLEMGLTVMQMGIAVNEDGDLIMHSDVLVRETAYKQLTQDLATREELNRMSAADHQLEIEEKATAIEAAIEGGYAMEVLRGDRDLIECSHERIHEGLCLDCRKEIDAV
ncbi:hypothetical protein LCGC14_1954730 [marine sediment metagenome]|uniref:Uncharacterized protein n=1 Tax=marine sediment metagenome TaxID=412755 RepID=A0A0F9FGP0_9ZZZZ